MEKNQEGKNANTNNQGTAESLNPRDKITRLAVEIIPTTADKKETERKKKDSRNLRRIQIASVVIAAFALGVSGYVGLVTYTGSRTQLRAYVSASPGAVYHLVESASPLQVYTAIENSGQTIAHAVERRTGILIKAPPEPDDFAKLMRREDGVVVMSPRAPHTIIREAPPLNRDQLAGITSKTGDQRIYLFGEITYGDVFGRRFITRFCHVYYGAEKSTLWPGYVGGQAKYCDKHNCADEGCAAPPRPRILGEALFTTKLERLRLKDRPKSRWTVAHAPLHPPMSTPLRHPLCQFCGEHGPN